MSARKQDILDFDFIFNESLRLKKLLNKSSYDKFGEYFDNQIDRMCSIINPPKEILEKLPNGIKFQLHLSSSSQKKLRGIARRYIKSNKLTYNISVSEFMHDLRDSIYIHAQNNNDYNSKGYSKILTRAYKRSQRQMKSTTYFFPFNSSGIDSIIKLGNASIIPKEEILKEVTNHENKFIIEDSSNEYDSFISIKISTCSNNISYKKALNIVDLIYGIIMVFATSHQASSDKITLLHKPITNRVTHHITYSKDNDFDLCGNYQFKANNEKFWNAFIEDLNYDLGNIVKELIDYAINPTKEDYLTDRLIDSFCWFGDASQDNNNHSQVVKLVTSMERIITLSTERNDGKLTDRFAKRSSCLIAIFHGGLEQWEEDARQIYKLRSDLVHGSRSLYKSYIIPLKFNPFKIACFTILSACVGFKKWDIHEAKYEPALKEKYDLLVKHCNDNCKEMNEKPTPLQSKENDHHKE